ncbi:MAG: ATP-binding protein, partial [Desulfurococcales archaeon]|nr:ATP-binding protein [Desulfurococcales archaeon]
MGVFVDRGYRTLLGLPFYDRVRELEFLSELLGAARTVVVYGPRNVGKSELARYYAQRRSPGSPFLLVDARRRSAEGLGLARPGVLRELLGLADKLLSGALRAPSLVGLAEGVSRVYRSLGPGPITVVVDEFHLLYTSRREALLELERAAGYLAKRGEPGARLVVTSSEGFVTLGSARRRLLGYSAGYLPVEGLDKGHMEALYSDYRARYSCGLGFKVYWGVFGGSPGYLVEACSLGEERLFRDYIPGVLRDVVDEAIASISAELSEPPSKVLEQASRILGGP